MTRAQFEAKAIRALEQFRGFPPGWWGTYRDIHGPEGQRVRGAKGGGWIVRLRGVIVSRHDSRMGAITKARKLATKALAGKPVGR